MDSSLEPPERTAHQHLRTIPVRPVSDSWPPEISGNKFVLFYIIKVEVICYGSQRKLMPPGYF